MEIKKIEWPLFESIRLLDGTFKLLALHQQRINRTRKLLWNLDHELDLQNWLQKWSVPQKGLYKCRLNYGKNMDEPVFIPYQRKPVCSLLLIDAEGIEYSLKYNNRQAIDQLFKMRESCDDVLITKKGMVADSSYSNIVFRKGNKWITPNTPLLKGVQREWLLKAKIIREAAISAEKIHCFETFKLVNAMIPWEDAIELPVSAIKIK